MRELSYSEPKPRRVRKPKGPTAKYRAKRARAEGPVKKAVRELCVDRDGYCRAWADRMGSDPLETRDIDGCAGPSEWAHIETRARTRNMQPELRHNTATSLMLCRHHHNQLDGRARTRLRVDLLTGRGADGPLRWRLA